MAVQEATLVDIGSGLAPGSEGWFVVNVRDAAWFKNEAFGYSALFQEHDRSPQLGVNIGVLEPGHPNCLYHEESFQEAFLVLDGECILIVEGEERRLKAWDFFHCPPGTRHVFVGAGDAPCTILCIGARGPDEQLLYPVDETAAKHGASAKKEAREGPVAYAGYPEYEPARPPQGMPWDR
jgi:uncharacterized cupin superfamily protein